MCGIAGYMATSGTLGPWFAETVARARHRGPDGDGWWRPGMESPRPLADLGQRVDEPAVVALGFLRLRILDLTSAADQPMVADDRATLAFNGEIYNYVELRSELRSRGHVFHSTGDTEVLLRGWLEWGSDLLPRLDGMFAFAIYDHASRSLVLARDRFGEKPLFWTRWRDGVAFASEVKQLAGFPGVELRLDPVRAASYLATGRPYDGASSWFEGIHQVEPGTWLRVDAQETRHGRYFDLAAAVRGVQPLSSPDAWAERFAATLTAAVRLRLRSDVPVGTSLSSGVDSAAVLAEATALGHQSYHSFTLGAEDPRLDERPAAQRLARSMGSVWHDIAADQSEFAAAWDRMTWHHESPVPGTSLFGQWKVMEAARAAGVIVLLDGQGADEVLGGYHHFFAAHVVRTVRTRPWDAPQQALRLVRHLGGLGTLRRDGYRYLGRAGGAPDPAAFLRLPPPADRSPSLRRDPLAMRLADVERWSLPNLLTYADRNAMAHSVETRFPFLAPDVAVLALAMPADVLLRDGWTKWPLRRALAERGGAPPAWRRGKGWFGVPQAAWLDGALAPQVRAWSERPHPAWEAFVDPFAVAAFQAGWRQHRGTAAWDDQAFCMVALDRFLRVFFPTEPAA